MAVKRYDPVKDFDPHRHNPDVHFRLYLDRNGEPCVICVQDFDYPDYDASRFLSPDAWKTECDAERALDAMLRAFEPISTHNMTITFQFNRTR